MFDKSLHDVSCANKNRETVVFCFRLAFHSSGMQFWGIYEFKIFLILYLYDEVIIR